MDHAQLFSRRVGAAVDFRPDTDPTSPFAQLRRLSAYMASNHALADDIIDCPEALATLREFTYRKIFTGTSHEDFVKIDTTYPEHVDWSIAIHEVEAEHFRNANRKDSPGESNHFQTRKQPR